MCVCREGVESGRGCHGAALDEVDVCLFTSLDAVCQELQGSEALIRAAGSHLSPAAADSALTRLP